MLSDRQRTLVEDLHVIEDAQERLTVVVDRARRRPPLSAAERTDAARVEGCQSAVWLHVTATNGLLDIRADSDSPLVRGLVWLLADFFSGEPVASAAFSETTDPIALAGLEALVSSTRHRGLAAVRQAIARRAPAPGSPP
jgi:sulfur transfer protein SufE